MKKQVGDGIRAKYDLELIGERTAEQAVQKGTVRLYGQDQDVSALVREAKQQVLERLHAETRRQLGLGAELDNAAAVVLAHNHPSGVAEPSMADQQITQRLKDALALVDIRVLDQFIVTAEDSVSFAERGRDRHAEADRRCAGDDGEAVITILLPDED